MWPGAYNRHITQKYINELWHLIQACFTQKAANTRDSAVIFFCCLAGRFLIGFHCSKLNTIKNLIVKAIPFLTKKNVSFGIIYLYKKCDNRKKPGTNKQ